MKTEKCKCGGTFVRRTNKSTRQRFLGCDKWPKCTHTKSVAPEPVQTFRGPLGVDVWNPRNQQVARLTSKGGMFQVDFGTTSCPGGSMETDGCPGLLRSYEPAFKHAYDWVVRGRKRASTSIMRVGCGRLQGGL